MGQPEFPYAMIDYASDMVDLLDIVKLLDMATDLIPMPMRLLAPFR